MFIDQVLAQLEGVKQTREHQWSARCPAHEDRTASLSVKEIEDGRILIYDFAGCEIEAILRQMGLKFADLYPKPLSHHMPPVRRGWTPRELLDVIAFEADVVWILLEEAGGKQLSGLALERVQLAAERIGKARMHARGY